MNTLDVHTAGGAARQSSKKFKGESLIRVVLEKLMEHMGGLIVAETAAYSHVLSLVPGGVGHLAATVVGLSKLTRVGICYGMNVPSWPWTQKDTGFFWGLGGLH